MVLRLRLVQLGLLALFMLRLTRFVSISQGPWIGDIRLRRQRLRTPVIGASLRQFLGNRWRQYARLKLGVLKVTRFLGPDWRAGAASPRRV